MMVPRVTPKVRSNPYGSQVPDLNAMEKNVGKAIGSRPGWDRGKKTGWRGGALPPGARHRALKPSKLPKPRVGPERNRVTGNV